MSDHVPTRVEDQPGYMPTTEPAQRNAIAALDLALLRALDPIGQRRYRSTRSMARTYAAYLGRVQRRAATEDGDTEEFPETDVPSIQEVLTYGWLVVACVVGSVSVVVLPNVPFERLAAAVLAGLTAIPFTMTFIHGGIWLHHGRDEGRDWGARDRWGTVIFVGVWVASTALLTWILWPK